MGRGLNSYSNRRDSNEPIIVDAIRETGVTVTMHDRPWDICATYKSVSRWAEVKAPRNKKNEPKAFTDKQIETLKDWPNQHIDVLVTYQQGLDFAKKLIADSLLVGVNDDKNLNAGKGASTPNPTNHKRPI